MDWAWCKFQAVESVMHTEVIAFAVFSILLVSIWLGFSLRNRLPNDHFKAETKETVKLAMGLVATMTALILGLLVSSAKGSYDANRSIVIQLAAKVTLLDRTLALYGPESAQVRAGLLDAVLETTQSIWPQEAKVPSQLAQDNHTSTNVYLAILGLDADSGTRKNLKTVAANLAVDIGQLRALLQAQSVSSISMLLLGMVVLWLVFIFFCFSLIAPPNKTSALVLVVSALSVAGAILLLLELDRPFDGMISISNESLMNAMKFMAQGS